MSMKSKKIIFIIMTLFITLFITACTNKIKIEITGEEQMTIGAEQTLQAIIKSGSADLEIDWKSSNASIATIDQNGKVIALSEGSVDITATVVSNTKVTFIFTITINKPLLQGLTLQGQALMKVKETQQLTYKVSPETVVAEVEWKSSNLEILSVDNKGLVTAHKEGKATITISAKTDPTKKAELEITVSLVTYTIEYNLLGGENNSSNPSTYSILSSEITLADPTKANHTFAGWYDNASGAIITKILPSQEKNIVLYAKWLKVIVDYNITYHLNGGTNPSNAPTVFTELVKVDLPTPTKENHDFIGWYKNAEFSGEKVSSIPLGTEENQVLYAKWEVQATKYNIIFALEGGAFASGTIVPTYYEEGKGLAQLPSPEKEGFEFLGWYKGETLYTSISVSEVGELSLKAHYEEIFEYKISYDLAGGAWIEDGINSHNDFKKLFLKDMSVYLQSVGWTGTELSLTADGGENFMLVSYNYGDHIEDFFITNQTYAPKWAWVYTFIKAQGADTSSIALIRSNIHAFVYQTAWATWPYSTDFSTIKYEDYKAVIPAQESKVGPNKYTLGQAQTIPAPIKEGYEFLGWYLKGVLFAGISESTTGELELVAKWKKDFGDADVIEVGPDAEYKTLVEALAAAEEGTIILLAPGSYAGAVIEVDGIIIQGPNGGVNPNFDARAEEAILTSALTIKANNVVIDGIALASSIVGNPDKSISGLTMKNIVLVSFANPSPTDGPIMLVPKDVNVTYTNIVMENCLFKAFDGRMMIMHGSQIINLSVKDCVFYGTSGAGQYNDGFKLAIAAAGGFDVKGKVEFIGNHFEDYMQYPIWIGYYGSGTFDFFDNVFKDCCLYLEYNEGAISMNNYTLTDGEKAIIKIQYNTADNAQILARLRNAGATADNWEAYVNYNKIYRNINSAYISNQDYNTLKLIDASNNYYDVTPTAANFVGVKVWEPFYTTADDVPLYGQDLNIFALEYDLDGGLLASGAPKNYDSRIGLASLPLATQEGKVFLGWYIEGEKVASIAKSTTGKIKLLAKWREDALYVGESVEDYYYPTLAAALAVAKEGDKIIVAAGTYAGDVTINVSNLLIVGPNKGLNPNKDTRVNEAIISGKITLAKAVKNITIDGLAFTGSGAIVGSQVLNFKFVNNYVYNTTKATKAWQETLGYNEGFIYFFSLTGQESENLLFRNNKFDNVSNVNVNISYVQNVSFDGNTFHNFERDAIRFDSGGYNSGVLAFTNNEFTQDSLGGYNGIYFRIYGGVNIDDTIILIEGNKFARIGVASAGIYSGAISARNYQENGADILIKNNEFVNCLNYIRLRNNATAAKHAASNWVANIENNIFAGLPTTNYFANWSGSDTAITNPLKTHFKANYYLDNDDNLINNMALIEAKMLNVASTGSLLSEKPIFTASEEVSFFMINYDLDGGVGLNLVKTYNRLSEEIILPEPTKNNYKFLGWFIDDKLVTTIKPTLRGDLEVLAKWELLEGEIYTIEFVFDKGDWPTRDALSVQEVVDTLFTDYYNWAVKYNGYTGTYEAFCKGSDGKYQSGYWYVTINGKMRNATTTVVDESGDNTYFYNTPEYYYKWKPFFAVFNTAMLKVNAAQDFFIDTFAAMMRIYQFADWTQPTYYNAYLKDFYKSVQIPTEPEYSYRAGQEVVLKDLNVASDLVFLGWYDNPQFSGEAIKKIVTTDSGNKKFYAKWEPEIMATEIIVENEITEIARYEEHQLVWKFNPENTTDQRVEIESSDPSILLVTPKGLLRALENGTVTIRIKSLGSNIDKKMTIVVYSPGYFDISYETESYVEINETIILNAKYIKKDGSLANLAWESLHPSIASVSSAGVVSGLDNGVATIRVSVVGDASTYIDFVVTVLDAELSAVLKEVLASHESNIFTSYELGIGAGKPVYYKDIFGSLSKILYNDALVIDETKYLEKGNANTVSHGPVKDSTEFITVHYTGNMAAGSTASANANYFINSDSVSIHYVTGNDGVFHALDDKYVAYHAGDGTGVTFTWTKTGVMAQESDPKFAVFGVTANSKFSINGVETTIVVPTGTTAATTKVTDSRWINDMGLAYKVVNGEYYMGTTWWCYSQIAEGRICSKGGNNNSIGIESAVNAGTDLWLTWQITAQLVAKLMLDNDLDITRVVGHHFYSAKDCPQPLLENDKEIWWIFIDMVEHEYELLAKYKDYQFELVCNNPLVNNNGRIKAQPTKAEVITYTVKVKKGNNVEEITLATAINGIYSKGK